MCVPLSPKSPLINLTEAARSFGFSELPASFFGLPMCIKWVSTGKCVSPATQVTKMTGQHFTAGKKKMKRRHFFFRVFEWHAIRKRSSAWQCDILIIRSKRHCTFASIQSKATTFTWVLLRSWHLSGFVLSERDPSHLLMFSVNTKLVTSTNGCNFWINASSTRFRFYNIW